MSNETPISWTGWIRSQPSGPRGRWKLFCSAATEQACLRMLIDKAPTGCDKLVRQGDADPNEDKR